MLSLFGWEKLDLFGCKQDETHDHRDASLVPSVHVLHQHGRVDAHQAKNWQQPAGGGGGEDGGLGTGFVAVVSSGLSWSAAKGATADKLKAEKKRLYDANKHRDKTCSVTVRASLPGQHSDLLYAPAGAKFTKRLSCVVELLLVFFGLGAPLFFYYKHKLSRHVAHTVRKTIYIEGHAAPAGHDA